MDQQNHMEDNHNDLFSGEPDRLSSPSPHARGGDGHFNSEDAAWEMRDQAVAENQRHLDASNNLPTECSDQPDLRQTTDRASQRHPQPELDNMTDSDDIYGDSEDPVLSEDSDDTFDSYDDDEFEMIDPRNIITSSPTEAELIVKGFEFHNRLSEEMKNQFFPEDYLRQACQDIESTLPRKVQWRAWRAAEDRHRFLQNQINIHGEGMMEDADDSFQSAALDRKIVETTQSLPLNNIEAGIIHTRSVTAEIPGSELSHASIVRSKPYLSDLKPAGTRSQYPSLIPRSPQRVPSRASSLSSSTMPDAAEEISEVLPSTRTESLFQGKVSSTKFGSDKDMPSPAKSQLHEDETPQNSISSPYKGSSEHVGPNAHVLCTPSQKPIESAGMDSTRAVRGSPVRFQPDEMSRPDTPRPSFSNTFVNDSIEDEQPVNTWTDYRTPAVAPRSTSPSPSSLHSVEYTEDPDVSMNLREEMDIRGSQDSVHSFLQLQTTSPIPGLHLSPTDQQSASPILAESLDKIDDVQTPSREQDESSDAERREAWLKFDEILQKAKGQVSAKSKLVQSPLTQMEFPEFQELPQANCEDLTELSQVENQMDRSQVLPMEARISPVQTLPTATNLNAYIEAQSSNQEQQRPLPQLTEPWQEHSIPKVRSIDSTVSSSESISSAAAMSHLQHEHISQSISSDRMDRSADQSDQVRVHVPDSPPPELSSKFVTAMHQAKRGQRSATGVRNTTRGVAQSVKKSRAVSIKDKSSSTRRIVTGKAGPATGVQGDNVKIQKPRTSARATSRKAITVGKIPPSNDNVPEVPPLPEPEQMDIDETPPDQDLALPELTQEAAAAHAKAEAPSTGPSLKVNKTRKKSSPTKSKPAATNTSGEPKTPSRSTTGNRQDPRASLTPQSAGNQATPRRRSPRLLEREERAKAAAAGQARRRVETPVVEMDIDPPQTPSKGQESTVASMELMTEQRMQSTITTNTTTTTTTPKQKQAGKATKKEN